MIEMCRRCNGSGHYDEISGTASFHVTCPICGGAGYIGTGSPSKTLLDEFAMAAMTAIVGKGKRGRHPYGDDYLDDINSVHNRTARGAYDYAAAMMKERARRDEMGNIKEVK